MEKCPRRFSGVGQLYLEDMTDAKTKFMQIGSPSVSRAEVICPKPRRVTIVPYLLDSLNRCGSKARGLPVRIGNHGSGIMDVILNKDEDVDSDANNQMSFLCGSPPIRTDNPVVQDAEFAKLSTLPASPFGSCPGMKPPKHDKGSPSCGSPLGASPKVRIEGFACGSPDSRRAVSAIA